MKHLSIQFKENDRLRLMQNIEIDEKTKCWNWNKAKDKFGYGFIRINKQTYRVHRVMWLLFKNEPLPTAKYGKGVPIIDHLCCNKSCCNPDHLELVSQRTNLLRSDTPSGINAKKTHCIRGHSFSEKLEITDKKGNMGRRCVVCRNINRKKRRLLEKLTLQNTN